MKLTLLIVLVSTFAWPNQISVQLDDCIVALKAIPLDNKWETFLRIRVRQSQHIKPEVKALLEKADKLQTSLTHGPGVASDQTHAQILEFLESVITSQPQTKELLNSAARIYLFAQNQNRFYWQQNANKLKKTIEEKGVSAEWEKALANSRSRSTAQSFGHKLLSQLRASELGLDESVRETNAHYVGKARRWARVHGLTLKDAQSGSPDAIRIGKFFSLARQAAKNEAPTKFNLTSLEAAYADNYELRLAQAQKKNPSLSELPTVDDAVRDEIAKLYDPANPQRDNANFDPTLTLIRRYLKDPDRYRELVVGVQTEHTDTGNHRLFLNVPGVVKFTLEGEFTNPKGASTAAKFSAIKEVEGYDYEKGEFFIINPRKRQSGAEVLEKSESRDCLSCHTSDGGLVGLWNGREIPEQKIEIPPFLE